MWEAGPSELYSVFSLSRSFLTVDISGEGGTRDHVWCPWHSVWHMLHDETNVCQSLFTLFAVVHYSCSHLLLAGRQERWGGTLPVTPSKRRNGKLLGADGECYPAFHCLDCLMVVYLSPWIFDAQEESVRSCWVEHWRFLRGFRVAAWTWLISHLTASAAGVTGCCLESCLSVCSWYLRHLSPELCFFTSKRQAAREPERKRTLVYIWTDRACT